MMMKTAKLRIAHAFLLGMLMSLSGSIALAQNYRDLEDMQDENMIYYTEIYRILDDYPDFKYRCVYSNGEVEKVIVENVDNEMDRKRLELLIYDLKKNQEKLRNIPTRTGVYYSVDEMAEPAEGYNTFYSELYNNLEYPEEAKEWGAEGTVFVKFIIDSKGQIPYMTADADIESASGQYVKDLEQAAEQAVMATSGEWKPAEVNDVPVASWAVIPVVFKVELTPGMPAWVR
jgi:TonB family protein